ncbi:hypothetical protein Dimus_015364 [Dionaea muscipula]
MQSWCTFKSGYAFYYSLGGCCIGCYRGPDGVMMPQTEGGVRGRVYSGVPVISLMDFGGGACLSMGEPYCDFICDCYLCLFLCRLFRRIGSLCVIIRRCFAAALVCFLVR